MIETLFRNDRRMTNRVHAGAVRVMCFMTVASCGGGSPGTAPVATVTVLPDHAALSAGQTVTLAATTLDGAGNILTGRTVAWTTDSAPIATVSQTGVVTALATGTAHITATSAVVHGTATITSQLAFSSLAAATDFTCGVTPSAAGAFCWGSNTDAQLGIPAAAGPHQCNGDACSTKPMLLSAVANFATISAATFYACGITPAHKLYCWGSGPYGELANGVASAIPAPFGPAATNLNLASVATGRTHACGVTVTGAAYCWGREEFGLLGDGETADTAVAVPVPVSGGITFTMVSVGDYHACGVTSAGAAYCWGLQHLDGSLGDSTSTDSPVPVLVAGGLQFKIVSAGSQFTCGLTLSGAPYCWGENGSNYPVPLTGGLTFTTLSAGGQRTCALTTDGTAYCWNGYAGGSPAAVPGAPKFSSITVDDLTACAVTTAGVAYCWGDNSVGQLGSGSTTTSAVPTKVAGQP